MPRRGMGSRGRPRPLGVTSMAGMIRTRWFAAAIVLWVGVAASAAASGWFGLKLHLDLQNAGGTVRLLEVEGVYPESPAARAHVQKGDEIVEVEGKPVAGMNARVLEPLMKRKVGEELHLRLKHEDGALYEATLVAAPIPDLH